jgi:hypothetical protein
MRTKFWSKTLKGINRRRWEDNIKMDHLIQRGWEVVYLVQLNQDTVRWRSVVNTLTRLLVPQKVEHF